MSENYAFVLMVREKWWIEFRQRHHEGKNVHSFVVRWAAPPKSTSFILFYVTKPVGELGGYAQFIERKVGDPQELWDKYGIESVLKSRQKYEEFIGTAQEVSFVRFKNLHTAANPMSQKRLLMHLGRRRLSRRGFYVNRKTADEVILLIE